MAREPSITQDQVTRAAEAIREGGSKPTARAIRERLGTGSMATILKFLQAWLDSQVRPAEPPVVLPHALQKGLLDFVAAEVDRSRQELRAELDVANQANGDLIIECERQALTVENLTAALEAAHGDKAALSGQLREIEIERDAARQDASTERQAAEFARTELAKAMLRLEAMPRLEKELGELRQEGDRERDARVAAEQSSAVAAAKLEAAQEARTSADEALKQTNGELANVQQELKETRAANARLQAELVAKADQLTAKADLFANARPRIRKPLKPQSPHKKT